MQRNPSGLCSASELQMTEELLLIYIRHALSADDMTDDFRKKGSDGENRKTRKQFGIRRNAVRDYHFAEMRFGESLHGFAREYGVRCHGEDFFCAAFHESVLAGEQGARRVDDVIENDAGFSCDVSYDFKNFRFLVLGTVLVHDG